MTKKFSSRFNDNFLEYTPMSGCVTHPLPVILAHLDPKNSKVGKLNLASPALHPEFITLLAEVAEMSIEKGYKPLNWLDKDSSVTVMYCLNAAERHQQKAKLGIDKNNEEKNLNAESTTIQPMHLAQAAYNDLMAALLILKKPEADDRVFKDGKLKENK